MGLLLRRVLLALSAATLTMVALVVLTAWAALRVSWAVPDPGALAGPTELLDRHGEVIARFNAQIEREVVDLEDVSPEARDAIIVAEDHRFYEHEGVDPLSLVRAVATNLRTGGITEGGSTLTQQYVKSAFVGDEQTLLRKVREAVISIQLERDVSKDEILERYLNEVYFGQGAYGIEAAAGTYFGIPASELDAAQGATLAQLLPAPSVRNPVADPRGARARRDALLTRLVEHGRIDAATARDLRARDLVLDSERRRVETRAPAFTDHVRRQLEHAFGDEVMLTGALTVRTSLDLSAQQILDDVAAARLPPEASDGEVDAAMVALRPDSGEVLAMHGGRDMRVGGFNLATMMTSRQQGSALKPFVYAAALEDGLVTPQTRRPSPSSVTIDPARCVGHDGGPISVGGGASGSSPVSEALVHSYNTTYQLLGCELGGERVAEQARRMGVRNTLSTNAGIALGGTERGASPLDMASAYGTFANDGRWCPPRTILEITGPRGEAIEVPDEVVTVPGQPREPHDWTREEMDAQPEWLSTLRGEAEDGDCRVATHPSIARAATTAMEGVVDRGTGTRADIGRPQAGKTGTTSGNVDAWFVGYTPQVSLSVWVGSPDTNAPLPPLGGFSQIFGGTLPALMWADAGQALLADVEPEPFPEPLPIDLGVPDDGPSVGPARDVPSPEPEAPRAPAEDERDGDDDAAGAGEDDGDSGDDGGATEPPADPEDDVSDGGGDDEDGPGDGGDDDTGGEEEDDGDETEDEDDDSCWLLC